MTEATFWLIISLFNWSAEGGDYAVIEPAVVELSEKSEQEILAFDEILTQKLYALDTVAHAKEIGKGSYVEGASHLGGPEYFSPDMFLYVRCGLVANGRAMYEKVFVDPKAFPKDLDFEALLMVASIAYERKTGKEFDPAPTKFSYETFSNKTGWQ
ncbi:DUF4240 domain-containing protein [Buttiauxella sp. 3AFRM03]|uniref:DUF4240 domain-containing protein n=1 Tax=Buttiauxella sp. 3AFRM03 TaxID=2479367 RepID=UPI000EF7E6E6|nr:DUF4240 domain-containing protein [Buttiauxella sp. 3AFRM03]AYN27062.1 DUF4240 domain-containing protein [Buttiauxella sp. 3AFRM03]